MEIFQNASDDQLALMGCGLALVTSALVMYFSYFIGSSARAGRGVSSELEHLRTNYADQSTAKSSTDSKAA